MAHYFFHILDGLSHVDDDEGMQLSGLAVARAEALRSLDDLIMAARREQRAVGTFAIEMTDEDGNVIGVCRRFVPAN